MENVLTCLAAIISTLVIGYFILYRKYIRQMAKQYEKLGVMQAKMLNLFSDFEDMVDGFEEYVEEVKKEIGEVKDGVQEHRDTIAGQANDVARNHETVANNYKKMEEMVELIRNDVDSVRKEVSYVQQLQQELRDERLKLEPVRAAARMPVAVVNNVAPLKPKQYASARQEQVLKLSQEGMTAAQIARSTGFSKGEVELIIEMEHK